MAEIGVRELKARASEIIKDVRDHRARYIITYRGRAVGLLSPIPEGMAGNDIAVPGDDAAIWQELIRLGEEIGRGWESSQSAVEILSEMRR
ncbi:MAG: type II toxin-antitoxin system Phd/YefM family antitoxin [Chloroflexi bacterium]|nr:type II toxin-antitoxin system Phd/YefM family antitoxin [Chloroflexota bacterium]